jgi:hypothetical protein
MLKLPRYTRDQIKDFIGLSILIGFILYCIIYVVISGKIDNRIRNEAVSLCAKHNQLAFKVGNGYICGKGVVNPRTE